MRSQKGWGACIIIITIIEMIIVISMKMDIITIMGAAKAILIVIVTDSIMAIVMTIMLLDQEVRRGCLLHWRLRALLLFWSLLVV
ncbi:hypothetical protein D1872_274890 [compost metagenome]